MEVQISNTSKRFGKNIILEDINLVADAGEILCLLGPSGAGKTTLIRLIIGAIKADSGVITIDGRKVPEIGLIRHIGYMPQNDAVYNDLSGLDNLAFFGNMYKTDKKKVRERVMEMLELERLMLTPIKRYQVVLGYTFGFGIFAMLQSIFITLYSEYVLQIQIAGSIVLCISIMILLAFAAVSTGTLISIFANNEFQVVQFIPVIIIPQIFFSGLIPIDTLPFNLGNLAYIMPIYYGCSALRGVILKGFGLSQVWEYMAALLLFTVLISIINTFALKKYREI